MAKKVYKTRVIKSRNSNTMSESAFWGWIRSSLRMRSRWWKPISEAKQKAKRNCKNCGRQKFEYQCNKCKKWFPDKEVEVDHIIDVGSLRCKEDVGDFIERLFCEVDGLQVVCKVCHQEKTNMARNNKKLK